MFELVVLVKWLYWLSNCLFNRSTGTFEKRLALFDGLAYVSWISTSLGLWFCRCFKKITPIFGEMLQFDEHIFQMGWLKLKKTSQTPSFGTDFPELPSIGCFPRGLNFHGPGEWVSVIQAGDFFQASELRSKDGQTYLKLADQDGDLSARLIPIPNSKNHSWWGAVLRGICMVIVWWNWGIPL